MSAHGERESDVSDALFAESEAERATERTPRDYQCDGPVRDAELLPTGSPVLVSVNTLANLPTRELRDPTGLHNRNDDGQSWMQTG